MTDAHRTTLGTSDADNLTPATRITDAIAAMVTATQFRQVGGSVSAGRYRHGIRGTCVGSSP
ncbi:hypothetical protein [Streptomyces sp. NBC_01314]|uniref:hypothetical protein n=1 Tax=Streptomyces sp. NBC_01314 TaxID=2903821 RepID=UPI00352D7D33